MKQVIDRFIRAISKQLDRRNRQKRETFTPNEDRAILFYGKAVQQLQALEEQ